jgi:hypothetical protein
MADWKVKKPQMSFFRKFGGLPLEGVSTCRELRPLSPWPSDETPCRVPRHGSAGNPGEMAETGTSRLGYHYTLLSRRALESL